MHFLYIIYSQTLDKFYIGETHNLAVRIKKHNQHEYSKAYTKAASDWIYVLQMKCNNKEDALYLEKFIKRMKSRKFVQKIIDTPKTLEDILLKR
ncbi:GIY-YIG nuclease family protein [Tenacibaculum sp. 190524A05c]|uniref:GIY-YIG nuclease family protein n=1 Tax=Tenacibaculum platacis TaxID=3137852 RepID=UPI0032B2571E